MKRLPWLRRRRKTEPEIPLRLPVAAGAVSNGEGWWPDTRQKRLLRRVVLEKAEGLARRHGLDRREFLASACGMATTLWAANVVSGCGAREVDRVAASVVNDGGHDGGVPRGGDAGAENDGGFAVPDAAMEDEALAECVLGGRGELIVDMQTHTISDSLPSAMWWFPVTQLEWAVWPEGCTGRSCFEQAAFEEAFFLESDTTIAMLSGISYGIGADGTGQGGFAALTNEEGREVSARLDARYQGRSFVQAMVMPNDRPDLQLDVMAANAEAGIHGWKTYTPWGPATGPLPEGYWLDQDVGPPMIQRGLDLGVPIFCCHKGLPLSSFSPKYTNPRDVGPVANMFPQAHFVIYHSAFEHGLMPGESSQSGLWPEGSYSETDEWGELERYPLDRGVNSLIKSLRDNGIGPNGTRLDGSSGPVTHVYAECGAVWPNLMLTRVEEAMHYWGKLLEHVGEDRILWGTDCLWFGSPQPIIEAFRAFQISKRFQEKYGYPALTPERKAKILGQNAARLLSRLDGVEVGGCHADYAARMDPVKRAIDEEWGPRRYMLAETKGPRTRREFLALARAEHREKLAWSGRPLRRG